MSGMKDCKFCDKRGLLWLPLRYGAVGAANLAALDALPKLAGKLGTGVSDLTLTKAKYAVRLLRSGYLYVLIERQGVKYWEAYRVTEDAFLYKFAPENPPLVEPKFSCERHTCGINASMVAIPEAKDVPNVWSLFTPAPLTTAKLDEYKANAAKYVGEGKLQTFSPSGWLDKSTEQPHTLLASELMTKVAEFILFKQPGNPYESELGKALEQQLFPANKDAYAGAPPDDKGQYFGRLGSLYNTMKRAGYATFVLHDHIGITQELNDFRNAPIERVQKYLGTKDKYGASNERRLNIYESIEEIKAGYFSGCVNDTAAFHEMHRQSSDDFFQRRRNQAQTLRQQGHAADAAAIEADIERSLREREKNYAEGIQQSKASAQANWKKKYSSRLDESEMLTFRQEFDSITTEAFKQAEQRFPDHLKWFESARLIAAFDALDPKDMNSGYSFAAESAICSIGMSGCKAGEDKIDAWVKAPDVTRANLYMRGVYFNQEALIANAKKAFDDVQNAAAKVDAVSDLDAALVLKLAKNLVSGFKSVDSAFDEWARNQGQAFSQSWVQPNGVGKAMGVQHGFEILFQHKVSEMARTLFRSGVGGKFDKALTARISVLLYAKLGAVAEKLAFDVLMLKTPDPRRTAEGFKGRSAERNAELEGRKVARKNEQLRAKTAAQLADEIDESLGILVDDAKAKAKSKVKLTLEEMQALGDKGQPTNNYHQARIGVVLGCIEMIALGDKLWRFENSLKGWLEVGGSIMAVGSIVLDTYYAAAKSIREIAPYKSIKAIKDGADIVRGGFKLGAGVLGAGAGLCSAFLDSSKVFTESDKNLKVIYTLRAATGFAGAGVGMLAALSYAEPFLMYTAKGYAEKSLRYRLLTGKLLQLSAKLALRVRLLVWVARLNLVGLALTAIEIGYLYFKDDDLQNWCEKSTFRKEKKTKTWLGAEEMTENFADEKKELEALEKASQAVGVGA